MKHYVLVILLGSVVGCTTAEEKDCIEYKSRMEVVERCTPLYGTLVCVAEQRPRIWCTLYNEDEVEVG